MRNRFFRWAVILVALLAAAVAGLLWSLAPRRVVTLTNGHTIHYLGTSHGTNHVMPGSSRLVGLLPRSLRSWLGIGAPAKPYRSEEPEFVFWLRGGSASLTNRITTFDFQTGLVSLLVDDCGSLIGDDDFGRIMGHPAGREGTFGLPFRVLPRRNREITLRFFDGNHEPGRPVLGELTLANPAFETAPVWEAESLPVSRTNGPVVCRLERLVSGVRGCRQGQWRENAAAPWYAAVEPGFAHRGVALCRFEEPGTWGTNWSVVRVGLSDATGNRIRCSSQAYRCRDGLVEYPLDAVLCRDETWALSVWAKHRPKVHYNGDEVILLEDIENHTQGEINRVDLMFHRHGTEVRVGAIAGLSAGAGERGPYLNHRMHNFRVELRGMPEDVCFDVAEILDEEGRKLDHGSWIKDCSDSAIVYWVHASAPAETKRLTARLVLQRLRRFDFRVKPEVVGTNSLRVALEG